MWAEPGLENRQAGCRLHTPGYTDAEVCANVVGASVYLGKKCPISLKSHFSVYSKRSYVAQLGLCGRLPGQALNFQQCLRENTKG